MTCSTYLENPGHSLHHGTTLDGLFDKFEEKKSISHFQHHLTTFIHWSDSVATISRFFVILILEYACVRVCHQKTPWAMLWF